MVRKASALPQSFIGSSFAAAGQAHKVDELTSRIEELETEIEDLRSRKLDDDGHDKLQERIEELVAELSSKQGIENVSLNAIDRNSDQPRQTFPAASIQSMAESLRNEGQHTPVILLPRPNGRYLLFDGERRWRGAFALGWESLKAVVLPAASSMSEDEIRRKALSTTLHREDLHPLDLAECLISEIVGLCPDLQGREGEIARMLNAVMSRWERERRHLELVEIRIAEKTVQSQWLDVAGLKTAEERAVLEVILGLQLHPGSVDANIFPMLKLGEDLKAAIRAEGLEASKARELDKLREERLKVASTKVQETRAEAIRRVLDEKMSVSQVKLLVKRLMAEHAAPVARGDEPQTARANGNANKVVESFKQLDVNRLPRRDLEALRAALQEKLAQITQLLD